MHFSGQRFVVNIASFFLLPGDLTFLTFHRRKMAEFGHFRNRAFVVYIVITT